MIGISYAITACNEITELELLLTKLENVIDYSVDEIIILLDKGNTHNGMLDMLCNFPSIKVYENSLNKDFSQHKNFLFSKCKKDYIFNIDADEYPSEQLLTSIKSILQNNPTVDMFWIPRINTVEGITNDLIKLYNWNINDDGYINFPDYQTRIIKNNKKIHWVGKVHERLFGYTNYGFIPKSYELCLIHNKQVEKQIKQNNFYNTF